MSDDKQSREGLILRVLWMVLFAIVWQVAELVLLLVVLVQLVLRLINGRPQAGLMDFGDSLSQYLAQIGRFGCFHSDEKPWPFADWPTAREPQGEGAQPAPAHAAAAPAAPAGTAGVAAMAVAGEAQAQAEPERAASAGEIATPGGEEPAEAAPATADEATEMSRTDGPAAPAEPRA